MKTWDGKKNSKKKPWPIQKRSVFRVYLLFIGKNDKVTFSTDVIAMNCGIGAGYSSFKVHLQKYIFKSQVRL